MPISLNSIVAFHQREVAHLERHFDVGDYLPGMHLISGLARLILGVCQILLGLGLLLKSYHEAWSQKERLKEPCELCYNQFRRQISWRLLSHGTGNSLRALAAYSWTGHYLLISDCVSPKLLVYSAKNDFHQRHLDHLGLVDNVRRALLGPPTSRLQKLVEEAQQKISFPPQPMPKQTSFIDRVSDTASKTPSFLRRVKREISTESAQIAEKFKRALALSDQSP